MATYSQADLGCTGTGLRAAFGLKGTWQTVYVEVEFPKDITISSMGMQVGQAVGYTTDGKYVPAHGKFYGRYCIWDTSGNLLAQTNVVEQGTYNTLTSSRPFTYGTFTSTPKLKKNTTYRIGYYKASERNDTYHSSANIWSANIPVARRGFYIGTNGNLSYVTKGQVDAGAPNLTSITASTNRMFNGYYWTPFFNVVYEEVKSGGRFWNGSSWVDRGVMRWNGSEWKEVPLKIYKDGTWKEAN